MQRPAATRRAASRGSEQQAEPPQREQPWEQPAATRSSSKSAVRFNNRGSCKVQKQRRNKSKTKLGLYHVSRRAPWRFGITSRARATLGITAARAPPHAGRWESLDTHAGTRAGVSRITVTCRVRNNRIICQSSDPLEGMAITLNQWILLTARAARPDAVVPNARRGRRLPRRRSQTRA